MRESLKIRLAMLVTFSGIDGSGKSTQIANLCACLEEIGFRVKLITFWNDVATLKRVREGAGYRLFKGDKGIGTPETPIHRRDKNVRSPLITVVRLAIYLIDAISLRRLAQKARRSEADIVIFDRYMYDELANLNLQNPATRLYLQGIMKVVPRPEISFVLDADPAQARSRKPEYPLEFLCLSRNAYLKLSELLAAITVIPPLPLEQGKVEVMTRVLHDLSASRNHRDFCAAADRPALGDTDLPGGSVRSM